MKRERYFVIVSDRLAPLSDLDRPCTPNVFERFMTVSKLFWS